MCSIDPTRPCDPLQESSFSAVDGRFDFPTTVAGWVSLFIRCKLSRIYFLLLLKASVEVGITSGNGMELKILLVCRPRHARNSLSWRTGVRLYYNKYTFRFISRHQSLILLDGIIFRLIYSIKKSSATAALVYHVYCDSYLIICSVLCTRNIFIIRSKRDDNIIVSDTRGRSKEERHSIQWSGSTVYAAGQFYF